MTETLTRDSKPWIKTHWLNQVLTSSLLVALIGAIPQYGQWVWAVTHDVPSDRVDQVIEQKELWEENFGCYKQANSYTVNTVNQELIELTVCPNTGDLLLKLEVENTKPIYQWIAHRKLLNLESDIALNSGVALAVESPLLKQTDQSTSNVLCQTMLPDGTIKRVIQQPDGQCVEEIVNPYTGEVISQTTVACYSC